PARTRTVNGPPSAALPKSSLLSHVSDCDKPGLSGSGGGFSPPSTQAARCLRGSPLALRMATSTSLLAEIAKETTTLSPSFFALGGVENATSAADATEPARRRAQA